MSEADKKAFDDFWKAYPLQTDREAAWRAWQAGGLTAEVEAILAGIERLKKSDRWQRNVGHQNPANFLKKRGWLDQLPEAKARQSNAGRGAKTGSRFSQESADRYYGRATANGTGH